MEWQNIGYKNPYDSTILANGMQFENDGDFRADVIELRWENFIGGSSRVCLIRQGELFLDGHNITAALGDLGMQRCGQDLLQQDSTGLLKRIAMDSDQGLCILSRVAQTFTGFDDHDAFVVHIGMPEWRDSQPERAQHRFDGDISFYPEGTPIETILRNIYDNFNDKRLEDDPDVAPYNTAWGSFAGLTREIRTRADLTKIGQFRDLEQDENGNPVVYRDDGTWIGPDQPELVAMWHDFPDYQPEHKPEHKSNDDSELNSGPDF